MNIIKDYIGFMKTVFSTKGWWHLLPFTLVGLILSLAFFICSPVYMLLDYLQQEIKKILYGDNESISQASQCVKFILGFACYFNFAFIAIVATLPLAVLYFLSICIYFLSSLGKIRKNPFVFHTIA